jgi:carboxypeptidase PM20D1
MKKYLRVLMLLLSVLVAIFLLRATMVYENKQLMVEPIQAAQFDEQGAVQRFSQAIQIPTISYDDRSRFDQAAFLAFQQHLEQSFPLTHQQAQHTVINDYSLIYFLPGSDPTLKPALFMGHMDVVPVDENTADQWQQGAFSGLVDNDTIWGRGTIDDKVSVMALMEAMELLLSQDVQSKRGIYFAFGHDEEAGGEGAKAIAAHFAKQNIRFEFVLDEGGAVTEGLVPGTQQPIALVGVAEKGFVNLRLTVNAQGGHSSQPPNHTAAGILAQAIVNIEAHPFASDLRFFELMFDAIGYSTPLSSRLPMANLWLLSPLVEQVLLSQTNSAATAHTTIAVTMLSGSEKSNVLPTQASAVVNFRILPGDTIATVVEHVRQAIDDPSVVIETFMGNEASPISSMDSYGFKLIESTIRGLDQSVLVTPYLVQGATDSRHFYGLSDNVYRFMMVRLNSTSMHRFHGINEQIAIRDYIQAIQFYYAMVKQAAQDQLPSAQQN